MDHAEDPGDPHESSPWSPGPPSNATDPPGTPWPRSTTAGNWVGTVAAVRKGRLVVLKRRLRSDHLALAAEAAWLRRARSSPADHPVVALVTVAPPEGLLITEWAGSSTLAGEDDPVRATAALAAVAGAVGRLHLDGLVHGNLNADHVVLGANRLRLCSPAAGPVRSHPEAADDLRRLHHMIAGLSASWRRRTPKLDLAGWTLLPDLPEETVALGPFRLQQRLRVVSDRTADRVGLGRRRRAVERPLDGAVAAGRWLAPAPIRKPRRSG